MSLLENISNIGKGVKDFFAGETVKNIADTYSANQRNKQFLDVLRHLGDK